MVRVQFKSAYDYLKEQDFIHAQDINDVFRELQERCRSPRSGSSKKVYFMAQYNSVVFVLSGVVKEDRTLTELQTQCYWEGNAANKRTDFFSASPRGLLYALNWIDKQRSSLIEEHCG